MRQLEQAAVLGAGVMGAGIAAHLANGGLKVLLLDMVPKEPGQDEIEQGLSLADRAVRNRLTAPGWPRPAQDHGACPPYVEDRQETAQLI